MTRCDSCECEVHINYSVFICILDQAVRNYLLSVTSHLMKTFLKFYFVNKNNNL